MAHINGDGLALVKSFEGCVLHAYDDGTGVWTIGWGHTGDVTQGEVISQAQADGLLLADLATFEQCVESAINRNLTPNQFSACVSFAYNVGCGAFKSSMLLQRINAGDFEGASKQFARWIYADDKVLPGLVRRRDAEAALFLQPERAIISTVMPNPVIHPKVQTMTAASLLAALLAAGWNALEPRHQVSADIALEVATAIIAVVGYFTPSPQKGTP